MFCVFCGKEIPDDDKFCPYCGKRVEEPEVAEDNYVEFEETIETAPKKIVKQESKGSGTAVIIVLLIVLILGLGGGGYYLYMNGNLPFLDNIASDDQMPMDEAYNDTYDDESYDVTYVVGETYYVQTPLRVREEPNKDGRWLKREDLVSPDYENSEDTKHAVLEEDAAVTCYEVLENWMRIDSGWVCTYDEGEYLVR